MLDDEAGEGGGRPKRGKRRKRLGQRARRQQQGDSNQVGVGNKKMAGILRRTMLWLVGSRGEGDGAAHVQLQANDTFGGMWQHQRELLQAHKEKETLALPQEDDVGGGVQDGAEKRWGPSPTRT